MLFSLELSRFRGFHHLRAELYPHAFVSGANSAGKSTILEAISLAETCLRVARRQSPQLVIDHAGQGIPAYRLPTSADSEDDPVRHEFRDDEVRVVVTWTNGSSIELVWPHTETERAPFFVLRDETKRTVTTTSRTKALFAPVIVVPAVTPLDRIEPLKDTRYVERLAGTRLASRHFRNHLWSLSRTKAWETFTEFCGEWLPEMIIDEVELDMVGNRIAVFYRESGSRVPKELSWSGDGLQIFVQLLWHLFRAQESSTIVLDEPEVYLHPTLQKRLVTLLNSLSAQIVIASHSSNILGAAPENCILNVDRRRGLAERSSRPLTP